MGKDWRLIEDYLPMYDGNIFPENHKDIDIRCRAIFPKAKAPFLRFWWTRET